MLTLSQRLCSPNVVYWPLEETNIGHEEYHNCISRGILFEEPDNFTVDSYYNAQPPENEVTKKKLDHNASERDRRKKINHLYSSLRTLLPASDHMKKLSIPATVSFALKYIPELQQQVERLIRKRDKLVSLKSFRQQMNLQMKQKDHNKNSKFTVPTSIYSFSANQLNDTEFVVQISSRKGNKISLSGVLHGLEELGLSLLSASSFASVGGRVFHNLQLKVERSDGVELRTIRNKLMCTYHNKETFSRASIVPEKLYM